MALPISDTTLPTSNIWYQVTNDYTGPNSFLYPLTRPLDSSQPWIVAMRSPPRTESSYWQFFPSSNFYYLRNRDAKPSFQLGLTDAQGTGTTCLTTGNPLSQDQQWTIEIFGSGFVIGNNAWGPGTLADIVGDVNGTGEIWRFKSVAPINDVAFSTIAWGSLDTILQSAAATSIRESTPSSVNSGLTSTTETSSVVSSSNLWAPTSTSLLPFTVPNSSMRQSEISTPAPITTRPPSLATSATLRVSKSTPTASTEIISLTTFSISQKSELSSATTGPAKVKSSSTRLDFGLIVVKRPTSLTSSATLQALGLTQTELTGIPSLTTSSPSQASKSTPTTSREISSLTTSSTSQLFTSTPILAILATTSVTSLAKLQAISTPIPATTGSSSAISSANLQAISTSTLATTRSSSATSSSTLQALIPVLGITGSSRITSFSTLHPSMPKTATTGLLPTTSSSTSNPSTSPIPPQLFRSAKIAIGVAISLAILCILIGCISLCRSRKRKRTYKTRSPKTNPELDKDAIYQAERGSHEISHFDDDRDEDVEKPLKITREELRKVAEVIEACTYREPTLATGIRT